MLVGVINFALQGQQKNAVYLADKNREASTSEGPNGIVRTVKQDRQGNIWITSWEGVYKYDGTSFTNVTRTVSSARFFSVLEDNKGHFWFATVGEGIFYYDGKNFQHFTTAEGLADNIVTNIYEDQKGHIWFGTGNGISHYDGTSFRNIKIKETAGPAANDSVYTGAAPTQTVKDSMHVSSNQKPAPELSWIHNDVNAITADKAGKLWIATRGHATIYDGTIFTPITRAGGKPFTNVRSIIKDQKGNMWLGGNDGLWRYDGQTFTNFTEKFVGYIYEDKKGAIWTSSEGANKNTWVLSRYDEKTLTDTKPMVTEIATQPMLFGILEDRKGNIWFGGLDGVYRYDGKTVAGFKNGGNKK
ncbi:MAG: histidine kinase [Flavobacterium sp. BFFFF2]|nr:MAG: histidine kinase [Flavobacterium sp. BFFFF2]